MACLASVLRAAKVLEVVKLSRSTGAAVKKRPVLAFRKCVFIFPGSCFFNGPVLCNVLQAVICLVQFLHSRAGSKLVCVVWVL